METLKKIEFIPSKEELYMIEKLQEMLKEYLLGAELVSDPFRNAIEADISDPLRLLKFLRGRKHNLQKACNSLIRYAQVSSDLYPDLFPQIVPDPVRSCFEKKIFSVLRHVDGQGRIVVVASAAAWDDPSNLSANDVMTAARIIGEALMDVSALYDNGLVIVVNGAGGKLGHAKQFTIPTIIKFIALFWQASPIPIKGLYFVKLPFFAKPVCSIVRPLIPKKLRERLIVSPELKELHERLPVKILPQSLGGILAEEEAMSLSMLELSI